MKSVKRLSRYTSILLSMLLMLSAMSPGLTALAQEKANAAPAVLTYEDDSITAELKATGGTSLPAGAALNVKALNKDSQDEAEKALYAETEAGLNAKASEQGTSIDGFTAYSITLTDKNKRDITPKTGSFTLKITDKNAAAPEAYKQSPDGQKSIALYQAAEAKDEQNNPVSTMEPKQEDAASINTDPDGNVTGVETALTTLKPVAVTWQNPQQQAMEEENAPSVQSSPELANNQFNYNFDVNGDTQNFQNFSIYFIKDQYGKEALDISNLLEERTATKTVSLNTPIPIEELMPEGLNYGLNIALLDGKFYIPYIQSVMLIEKSGQYYYQYKSNSTQTKDILVNDTSCKLYFACYEDFEKVETIDSASKGVTVQMFDYTEATPVMYWGNNKYPYSNESSGKLSQNLLKRKLENVNGELIPVRNDNNETLVENFSTGSNNYKGGANNLFRADKYNESNTFYYSSFENYAYWNGTDNRDKSQIYPFTVYNALGTPQISNNQSSEFFYWRGNFMPYNRIFISEPASPNVNRYDPDGNILKDEDKPANRKDETLYLTQGQDYYFGMVVTADFSQLKDGKIKDAGGESTDMVYDFNGDDDMWVFIDDVLVLDLGGIHDAHSGSIDFATGVVKWTDWVTGKIEKDTKEYSTTILDQFKKANAEKTVEWKGDTFADYTGHEIKIFYMERGAGASNCKMAFNLPTVPKDSVSITKEVTNVNEGAYTDVDFAFKLYVEDNEVKKDDPNTITEGGKIYKLKTEQPYALKEGTETIPGTEGLKTNEDGTFTLKHGQTAYFEELATQGQKYIVQEVGVNQDQYDEFKVTANATDEAGVNVNAIEQEDGTKIVQTAPLTVGTNTIVKMQNQCDGENLHTINITKQIDGGQASDDNFTAQVTIGGKPYTGKYKVADKDATEEAWESAEEKTTADGSISLKASQTIRIEKIAAGTSFEVTETAPDANKYNTPTYDVSNADAIDKTDKASGKVNFGSNPQITIINHLKLSADSISTNKTAKVHDWDDRTYDITLQASSNVAGDVVSGVPYDIVMVLDESGSMSLPFDSYEEFKGLKLENSKDYYYKTKHGIYQKLNVINEKEAKFVDTEENKKESNIVLGKDTIYVKTENSGNSKKGTALVYAAQQFLKNVQELSEDSRVGVVYFTDGTRTMENSDKKTMLRVGNDDSYDVLNKWIYNIRFANSTRSDLGLNQALKILQNSQNWENVENPSEQERKKMVVFFTDGVTTQSNGAYSKTFANNAIDYSNQIKKLGATVYALGVFDSADNKGSIQEGQKVTVKTVNDDMMAIANENCYMTADNAESLKKLFASISTDVGQSIEGATITDVIDSRFELTDEAKAELEASGAIVTVNDTGTTTITWNNQTINQNIGDTAGWERTFRVRAKEDYIGANNVTTNAAGSQVQVGEITKPFESPVVNVKADINLLDQARTIFYDETVPNEGDLLTRIGEIQQKSDDSKGKYGTNDCQIEWKDENGNATSIAAMTQDKPEKDTHYTVNVSYDAGAPSDPSTANTDGHKNGDDSNRIAARGQYDVHVVKGQLEITKTIDEPYTNIKQINANQTFVFKIERYEVEQNGNKGKLAETFYETINFNANETETEKTKLVSGLKKGYYTVTEETNWSQKYKLDNKTDNFEGNQEETADLLIGKHLKEAANNNGKPEFYGLDETKLKDNSGAELPADQQYRNFAEGSKATVKFTNNLSTTWKWLSDTAAAVNVFDQKAQ